MKTNLVAAFLLGACGVASAQVLFDNGGILTPNSPNGTCLPVGSGKSEVQLGNLNAGYNTIAASFHEADDFVVPSGQTWNVTGFTLPMYQTLATTPTVTQVFVQIWNGQPGTPGAAVIAGDLVTNRLASAATFTPNYRYFNATCGTERHIQDIHLNLTKQLTAGTYWVEIASNGSTSFSGPWWPTVTIEGQQGKPGANAITFTVATALWAPVIDILPQDFSFLVNGTPGGGCYADCNGDGTLNLSDFGCFQTKFAVGDPYADCNGDGVRNLSDFGCFQTKFALGCP
jgi:hypothetical protein